MSTDTGCPDPAKLTEYARNEIGADDAAAVERHLLECRTCLDRFVDLGKRSLAPEIPGCHVVKEIGRGRFGVVYKAWRLDGQPRLVALKVLSYPGEMETSRFHREIAVLKKLDSPWIVKCLESGETADAVYFVMDYVEGVHLDEYLDSSADDLNDKLAVFQRVCSAVADAHAMGVVHRDLKPRNILIDAQAEPHILDFGICAVETGDWSSSARCTITNPGDVVGTLKYMSPEQAWGGAAGEVNEKSDIWSLGVMLYGIVTDGDYPYSLKDAPDKPVHEALLERIRKELPRIPPLNDLPRGRELKTLLERCLAWEPDRRIESAAMLAEDLKRYRTGQRIKTKRLGASYRLKRLAVGAALRSRSVFAVLFLATLGVTLWFSTVLFDVGWRETGHQYQGGFSSAPASAEHSGGRDAVLVVGVFDDTVEHIVNFALSENIQGVTTHVTSWRAVHGRLMERLAKARPRAVVWDYFFRSPQPGDAGFVVGAQRLEQAGVPVVLGALNYGEDGAPDLSPGITLALGERLRHGAIVVRDMVERPGEFVTVIRKAEGTLVPSLALTTLAAVLHPEALLRIEWAERREPVHLLYEIRPGAYLRERDELAPTKSFHVEKSRLAAGAGDLLACNTFDLQPPERWERQTLPYQSLLTATGVQLRSLVENKVVLFGDLRSPRFGFSGDRVAVKFGPATVRQVPGCYLHAEAIAGLLDRRYTILIRPLPPTTFGLLLIVGAVGGLLPLRLARWHGLDAPRSRRSLRVLFVILLSASFAGMLVATSYALVHVAMACFSLLMPMAGSFWVEFTRNRHRITEGSGRGMGDFTAAFGGGSTLSLMRRKQPPEAM